jgi:hypothetical protein
MNDINVLLPDIKLRFNIDHPSYEECYAYGYECALAEIPEEENPYAEGSCEFEQWAEGWWAGFYGEEPLFPLVETRGELPAVETLVAANEQVYHSTFDYFLVKLFKVSGALAATMILGYQVIDLVA